MPFANIKDDMLGKKWGELLAEADEKRKDYLDASRASDEAFKNRSAGNRGVRTATRNKLFSIILTMVSSIIQKRTDVKVKATQLGEEDNARRQSILANWNFHVDGVAVKQEDMALNGFIKGVSVSFCSWKSGFSPSEYKGDAIVGKHSDKADQRDPAIKETEAAVMELTPVRPNVNISRMTVLDPWDYLQDPKARNMEEPAWAAHRTYMRLGRAKTLQSKKVFNPTVEIVFDVGRMESLDRDVQIESVDAYNSRVTEDEDGEHGKGNDDKVIEIWQVHDLETKQVLWVVPGTDSVLRKKKYHGIFPYQSFRPVHTHDEFWSFPITYQVRVLQERLNQVTESLVQFANMLGKPVVWVPKGITPEEKNNISGSQPGDVIVLSEDVIKYAKVPELSSIPEAIRDVEPILARDITDVLGFSDVASGMLSDPATTATEASLSSGFMSVRSGHIKWKFNNWLNSVAKCVVAQQQKYFTQADAVPILGLDAKNYKPAADGGASSYPMSDRIDGDNIAGLFDVVVSSGDIEMQLKAEKQRQILELLSIFTPWMQEGVIDPQYILGRVMEAFDLDPRQGLNKMLPPAPDPMSQQAPAIGRGPSQGRAELAPDMRTRRDGAPTMSNNLGVTQR